MTERLLIIGQKSGTHLGGCFSRAAGSAGIQHNVLDPQEYTSFESIAGRIRWRSGKPPSGTSSFQRRVLEHVRHERPKYLLTFGNDPVLAATVSEARAMGVLTIHFSSDDPWNRYSGRSWHRAALCEYDAIFTPRKANIRQLQQLTESKVFWLPFAYDETLFAPENLPSQQSENSGEVIFIGGADEDRLPFVSAVAEAELPLKVYGGFWSRYTAMRSYHAGIASPVEMLQISQRALVNICLVRRANRDGHTMRSFEIPACGGCGIYEDTEEHRLLFSGSDNSTIFFSSPQSLVEGIERLQSDPALRSRSQEQLARTVLQGKHQYRDRLEEMLRLAQA